MTSPRTAPAIAALLATLVAACTDASTEETLPPVSGLLPVIVRLSAETPVASAPVEVLLDDLPDGPALLTDERGRAAVVRTLPPGAILQAGLARPDVSGSLRARVDAWDGVSAVTIDPITTLVAAWRDVNPQATPEEALASVRAILGVPARVPDAQLLSATRHFSGDRFLEAAGPDLDAFVARVIAFEPSSEPRFGDPAGRDTSLRSPGATATIVAALGAKISDSAGSWALDAAQYGLRKYFQNEQMEEVRRAIDDLRGSIGQLRDAVSDAHAVAGATLTYVACADFSNATQQLAGVVSRLDGLKRRRDTMKRTIDTHPSWESWPLSEDAVASLGADARTAYRAEVASEGFKSFSALRDAIIALGADLVAEADRVQFVPGLLGDLGSAESTGLIEKLEACLKAGRSYLTNREQRLLLSEVDYRLSMAALVQLERLSLLDRAVASGRTVDPVARKEAVDRYDALKDAFAAGRPTVLLETIPAAVLAAPPAEAATDPARFARLQRAPAEVFLRRAGVILRVAEHKPIHGFSGILHGARASGAAGEHMFDAAESAFDYDAFAPDNTRGERILADGESSLLETRPEPNERDDCRAGEGCVETLRRWVLRATGGTVGQDAFGLDRADLFGRSIALAMNPLPSAYWEYVTKNWYQYTFVFDVGTWTRRKVVLYQENGGRIHDVCMGAWRPGLRHPFTEPPEAERPFRRLPPAGQDANGYVTQGFLSETRTSACLHATRDRYGSRLMTVRPATEDVVLWNNGAAKRAALTRLNGYTSL